MANGAFKFKDNSGNVVSFISGSGSNISFSGGTLDLSGMTGLTLGNLTLSGTTQNALSASHAASYLLTSSFNTYSGTTDTVIGTLQTSTGSLNSFTSSATTRLSSIEGVSGSYATTGSNQFKNDQVITGSLTVTGFIDTQELRTTFISSSILYRSGSTKFGDELSDNHSFTGSLLVSGSISVPGSNLVSGSAQVDVMSTTNIARLATTGSNTFSATITATGNATTPSFIVNNPQGSTGTAQHYTDFTAGATVLGRILRGNGASGLEANGLNIDNFAGFKVRLNQLGGSGGSFTIEGGNVGIGISAPAGAHMLQINNPTQNYVRMNMTNTSTGTSNTDGLIFQQELGNSIIKNQENGYFAFGVNGSETNLVIAQGGNVGVGVANPRAQLSIKNQIFGANDPFPSYDATSGTDGQNFFNGYYTQNSDGLGPFPRYLDIVSIGSPDGSNGGSNIRFFTNPIATNSPAVERVRISSVGNVGVGITTPAAPLTVRSTGATGILLEQDGSNSAVSSRLVARNNSVTGTIRYDSGGWRFNTNATIDATSGTERALISTDGYFRMLSGTGGVQFGGNTAASNALNAYEEGTWTPSILGATGESTYPSNRTGWYTRVGRLVTVTWFVTITKNNMTGTLRMSGLPFTLMSGGGLFYPQGTVLLDGLLTATNNITFQGAQNSSSGDFIGGNGSTATHTGLSVGVLGTGTMECRGTLTYFT